MELPIQDVTLAIEMAYAEKPYREMAKVSFEYDDARVQELGTHIGLLANRASADVYYKEMDSQRSIQYEALRLTKDKNTELYLEGHTPEQYILDLRRFSAEHVGTLGASSSIFFAQKIAIAQNLIQSRSSDFITLEEKAGRKFSDDPQTQQTELIKRLDQIAHRNNWNYLENKSGHLFISFSRHILGFASAAKRASERQDGLIPDFDDLPGEYAQKAYNTITDEWLAYAKLVTDHDSIFAVSGKNRPLLYNGVEVLSKALTEERQMYGSMTDNEIIKTFEGYSEFHKQCAWVMDQKHQKQLRARAADSKNDVSKEKAKRPTVKHQILSQTLENDSQRDFALSRSPDVSLPITDLTDIEKICKYIAKSSAEQMDKDYSEYIGGKGLFTGFNTKFAHGARPETFYGRQENVRMQHLPITEKFTDEYIRSKKLEYVQDFAVLARIGVIADLYSTGRGKIGEAMQEYVLYGRNIQNPVSRQIRIAKQANISGDKLVQYLNEQSMINAYILMQNNMLNPLSGGAPGLGKRR